MAVPAEELDPWDFDDAMVVASTRAGGGFMQGADRAEPVVYLELTGDSGVSRHVLDVDQVLELIVQLEHAGKTAVLMEHVLPR